MAFTWNIVALESRAEIRDMLGRYPARHPAFRLDADRTGDRAGGRCGGLVFLRDRGGAGPGDLPPTGWALLTTLHELKGFEEKAGSRRVMGVQHGAVKARQNWLDARRDEEARLGYTDNLAALLSAAVRVGLLWAPA